MQLKDSASAPHSSEREAAATDLIKVEDAGTLWGLFCERVRRSPDAIAYRDYDAAQGVWRNHDWRTIAARVDRFRAAFVSEGLQRGDRVALLLPNSTDWVCFDMAALGQGLVVVALYPDDSITNHAYILAHSEAKLALIDSWARWAPLKASSVQFPALARVWIYDGQEPDPATDKIGRALAAVLLEDSDPGPAPDIAPGELATLIYTSGTTGRPKGVMLSHAALLWNAAAVATLIPPRRDDLFLSVLPLVHAFERTIGCYLAIIGGATVAFSRSPRTLPEDMKALSPTVLLGVPRLFERLYAAVRARGQANPISGALLRLFAWLGWRRFVIAQKKGAKSQFGLSLPYQFLDRLIGRRLKESFGGRLRVAVSGGAALDPKVARILIGLGFPLVEGYGLTEAGPVVAATTVDDTFPGSAGRPLPGVVVQLGPGDELLIRSPSVMLGYWKDEEETRRALLDSGWLASGDIAEIKDERVFIRGRLKEIIILSLGEKINPDLIETEIAHDPLFKQVAVVGDGHPFLAALAIFEPSQWRAFARTNGLEVAQPNAPKAKELVLARLAETLAGFPRHAQIRAIHISLEPWTVAAGLLTPMRKVKRQVLQQRFAKDIEVLYAPARSAKPE